MTKLASQCVLSPLLLLLLVACGPVDEEVSNTAPDGGDTALVEPDIEADVPVEPDALEVDASVDTEVDASDDVEFDAPDDAEIDASVDTEVGASDDVGLDAPDDAPSDADVPICSPDCADATCGDDGCGGTCGECATECVDGSCAPAVGCPPEGPYGSSDGDTAMDYELTRCDGSTVTVHELCGNDANLIIGFAGWCPPCIRNAPLWQAGFDERADASFGAYFVINETNTFIQPDASYCSGTAERFGLTMPVLFDPTGGFASAFGVANNDSTIVLDSELRIVDKGQYRSAESVFSDIDALLAE